jgi:predicted transcriptional regulator
MSYHCETLRQNTCYDILPLSYKVIAFDTELKLTKALSALLQHGVQSAPVWSSKEQRFVGMLTVTDFIQLILYYVDRSLEVDEAVHDIERLTICDLRSV